MCIRDRVYIASKRLTREKADRNLCRNVGRKIERKCCRGILPNDTRKIKTSNRRIRGGGR